MTPQPVTLVLDVAGELVHDCEREGCSVSWDGYLLNPDAYADEQRAAGRPTPLVQRGRGDAIDGRTELDAKRWTVKGRQAQRVG